MASNQQQSSACAQLFKRATDMSATSWPIVYSENYNIQKPESDNDDDPHAFDTEKYRKIFEFLKESSIFSDDEVFTSSTELTRQQLLEFHTQRYLDSLRQPINISAIAEVDDLANLPMQYLEPELLSKLRLQAAGTILAARIALERKVSINLGGGFHHCSADQGGGFCFYADINAALKTLHREELIKRALIIDLDAHQGNGHERDFRNTNWVQTLDVYNRQIYPYQDRYALEMQNLTTVPVLSGIEDEEYLTKLTKALDTLFANFGQNKPDIIAYNAGTDCMLGDPLGLMCITPEGIIQRDEMVFRKAKEANIPIFMVLSGGYQKNNARVIADSILNLCSQGYITENAQ